MLLYHGSDHIIEKPVYSFGSKANDFGLGFYCTEDYDLAGEWACQHGSDGYVNSYQFDQEGLNILNLLDGSYSVLTWIAILLKHRMVDVASGVPQSTYSYIVDNFVLDIGPYDVIIGYRADDSYFAYARAFINNSLPINELYKAMHLGKLGAQVVLKTPQAFERLNFTNYAPAKAEEYFPRFTKRDTAARSDFKTLMSSWQLSDEDIFVLDIIREGIKPDDARLAALSGNPTKAGE